MAVLLRDALMPNLVQTLETNPAFIHGGPFANIAHGCNSVMATQAALKLADYTVTEAGFGADLGAEKFFDIKCRKAGLRPNCAVVVATVRALKMHGGVAKDELGREDVAAVKKGCANLGRHIRNVKMFGVPAVVAINRFDSDTEAELETIRNFAAENGVAAVTCTHWADGSAGTEKLAQRVVDLVDAGTDQFAPLYPDDLPLWEKVRTIATQLYGADDIIADKKIRDRFRELQAEGYGHFPICMAKTQYSFSTDPNLKGAPINHHVPIREVRVSAGAEFLVVVTGEVMTMPGLPRKPAAGAIRLDDQGWIQGLF
jgi:formate--tetrahydrofolate ligase